MNSDDQTENVAVVEDNGEMDVECGFRPGEQEETELYSVIETEITTSEEVNEGNETDAANEKERKEVSRMEKEKGDDETNHNSVPEDDIICRICLEEVPPPQTMTGIFSLHRYHCVRTHIIS